ncbi:MAG: plasmid pRiA4b ORF-3 family protein [Elusimicrobia bacterium]|nr:plasmid pRiA4b ORF-3 family protein [Elusimicrobiota bacterium]
MVQTRRLINRGGVPDIKKELDRAKTTPYQLKVTLLGTNPPIWRRIAVAGGISLGHLHDVLLHAMGWDGGHMHLFHVGKTDYGETHPELEHVVDQRKVRLCDVAPQAKKRFVWEYDMGDTWLHEIVVEKINSAEPPLKAAAVCLDGARACPPEDCGGVYGYEDFLKAIRDPKHESHDEMLEWIGGEFDPEAFDLKETNKALSRLKEPR